MAIRKKKIKKMADDDEIDILGDFSFNSCFALNNQGIPSCSSREDTVHPQWLLDSTETNWYDKQSQEARRNYSGPSRKLLGNSSMRKHKNPVHTEWSEAERKVLLQEMAKYGRNIRKISLTLKTKTEAEIQAFIDAEFGVHLDMSPCAVDTLEEYSGVPSVIQEEVVTDDSHLNKVVIIAPAEHIPKHPFRKKNYNVQSKNSLLKPNVAQQVANKTELLDAAEIFYEDDMIIGSTESIGSEQDMTDIISRNIAKHQAKVKAEKKIGNHRRKMSKNYDKSGVKSKDFLKSPQGRHRKDSSLSDESLKSPKMQIVLGSGQALPVAEGEQVIKIEKKNDSEPESDIEIDVDSDNEGTVKASKPKPETVKHAEEPIAVPLRKFEPMPRRQKKINLDGGGGGGGYTIMHTEAGDLYEMGSEPRRQRARRAPPVHLIRCRVYNTDKPAPCEVRVHVSTLILMDAHAHTSRGEVMGLTGGSADGRLLTVSAYVPVLAAAGTTHCEMEPVSQSRAAERLASLGVSVCGWHHSHPVFPCAPSAQDLHSQRALQRALEWHIPLLGFITSQHWPAGRRASQYRCLRVEEDEHEPETPVGYQLSVRLVADVRPARVPALLRDLRAVLRPPSPPAPAPAPALHVDLLRDVCPRANMTYLEKCISSVCHHMSSAGYSEGDAVVQQLVRGLRDVLR